MNLKIDEVDFGEEALSSGARKTPRSLIYNYMGGKISKGDTAASPKVPVQSNSLLRLKKNKNKISKV